METQPPIWKTPEFWRKLAEEWRGPETYATTHGICKQLQYTILVTHECWAAEDFVYQFNPPNCGLYFFPIGDRASRAALCDKIATHLATCQKTTCTHSNPETPTGGMGV